MSLRTVDPGEVWVRHISRCLSTDTGAVKLGGVYFRANDVASVNGEAGWISGEVVGALSDDGNVSIRFPNSDGADGKPHRDRFAVITQGDSYRIGEEWIEVRRDVSEPMAVVTPSTYKLNRTDLTIECVDPLACATLAREEALHVWNASPRDVIDYYTRLEMAQAMMDFRAKSAGDLTADNWVRSGTTALSSAGILITGANASIGKTVPLTAGMDNAWTVSAQGVCAYSTVNPTDAVSVVLDQGGNLHAELVMRFGTGQVACSVGPGPADSIAVLAPELKLGSRWDVRMWCRGEWVFFQLNGRTVAVLRKFGLGVGDVSVYVDNGPLTNYDTLVEQVAFTTVEPFLAEPGEGDRHLPGAPTPGGLLARFFNEPDAKSKANGSTGTWARLCLNPMLEPTAERLDPINHPAASPPSWQAPAVGSSFFSVRWTGAIYLDLAAADRNLRLIGGADNRTRIWIGKTGPVYWASPHMTGNGTVTGGSLRAHLGQQVAGWYPIVIETDMRAGSGGVILQDRSGAGAYSQVGTDRLSPFGVYSDSVQRESHRAMVTQITEAFALQWMTDPKILESGKFPGRIIPKVRAGRDTEKVIEADESSGMEVTGSATDSCDRLVLDAAGLPTKDGAAATHIEVFNDSTVRKHLYVSTAYDQASEISDETMLRQRASSMLALRAGAFEQIKVDPPGQNEVIDSWPLTGSLAKLKWEPGDGVRLNLPQIGQVDASPRQLTGISKPITPDGVGQPSVTWRQRPRGAREMILRSLRNSLATRRTYQNQMVTIDGGPGTNPTPNSVTSPSILFLPAGSKVVRLELRIVYLSGTGSAKIEINESNTNQVVKSESPIDLTAYAAPITAADQRITARLVNVSNLLCEIQLSALVVK